MDGVKFEALFSGTVQDLLMVTYLANLTHTQAALLDKLSHTL